ncbi:MAG: ABC transporter substrate-binding protein [Dehalococcoidia bacterium]|nr:ABC transporter substrate-binding protein [Dehalococcoidia bacterium]
MKANRPGRFVLWLSGLALLAVVAAACAPTAPAPTATPVKTTPPAAATVTTAPPQLTPTTAPSPKPTPAPVTKIRIAKSFSNIEIMPWFVAQKEGYYKEEGLEVEFVRAPGTAGLAALAAGEILLSDSSGSAGNATMEGAPFRQLLSTGRLSQFTWARDPVKKAADLVGKKFACSSPGDRGCLISQKFMQKKGLDDVAKVTWLGVGGSGDRLAALKSGAVDAAYLSLLEHIQMLPQEGKGFSFLGDAGGEFRVVFGGMATSTVTIRDQKDVLQRAIRAVLKGQRFVMDPTKRDKVIQYGMEWASVPKETATSGYDTATKEQIMFKDAIAPDQIMKDTIAFDREALKIKAEFQPTQLYDYSFIQAAIKELDAKGWKP